MNTGISRSAPLCATGLIGALLIAACDRDPQIGATDVTAPIGARAGNVATANLEPIGDGTITGTVTFAQLEDNLRIDVSIMGVPSGEHGLHLHETGDCSAPDASSAGGHFSPDEDPHGAPGDAADEHHAGDLGNVSADAHGRVEVTRMDPELSLAGEYGVVGRAVIVHGGADDLQSQPSGDAGSRVACGVIEWGTGAARE